MSVAMPRSPRHTTRGVVFIHGAPTAVPPHRVGDRGGPRPADLARLDLAADPAPHGSHELSWTGAVGTGAELASALRGWEGLRYEVTEDPTAVSDGSRWSFTPSLGIHHTMTSVHGDAVIHEDRLRDAMIRSRGDADALQEEIDLLLGVPWDDELEPFRYAGEAPPWWLHKVG